MNDNALTKQQQIDARLILVEIVLIEIIERVLGKPAADGWWQGLEELRKTEIKE